MTVNCVYNSDLSRVTITATGLGDAQEALIERSTDQVVWTTVRGGTAVSVASGSCTLDDYEFAADVQNWYRVTYADEVTYRSTGTAAHAANASVVPGLPAGHAQGDLLLLWACTRSSSQGVPDTPAGYSVVGITDQGRLFAKIRGSSESAPTVTFTGAGGATMSMSAQIAAFTKAQAVTGAAAGIANGVAQDIATPALIPEADNSLIVWAAWKQDDWTGSTKPAAATAEIGDTSTTLGDDQGITWAYLVQNARSVQAASSFTITGGATAVSRAIAVEFLAATTSQTGSITPTLGDAVWLKFIGRPFLNQTVDAYGEINVTRRARNALFPVVGRNAPIGVTDVRGGREFSLLVKTLDAEAHRNLDFAVAGGDPIFVHAPAGSPVPSMYALIGDTSDDQPVAGTHFWTLPLIEVSAPVPEIVGATITWQGVVNTYATWADLIAGEATWGDLLLNIGDPGDTIVD